MLSAERRHLATQRRGLSVLAHLFGDLLERLAVGKSPLGFGDFFHVGELDVANHDRFAVHRFEGFLQAVFGDFALHNRRSDFVQIGVGLDEDVKLRLAEVLLGEELLHELGVIIVGGL